MTESRNWKLPFFTIWIGQAVSLLGSSLVQFALIWWLTVTTGSAVVLAAATTVGILPTIFLGPFAGALVDRWPRKWVLILSDGSTALFTALLGILFWLGVAQPWHVFVILFLRSLGDAFQNPAMMATTPLMVPKEQLTRIASMNSTLQGILMLGAAPLGALLLELIDVKGVLPLDVLTAILAILPLFLIIVSQPAGSHTRGTRAILDELGEGLHYIWGVRPLRLLLGTVLAYGLFFQPIGSFFPLLVTEHFGGGAIELAWLNSAFGLGLIAGGLVLSVWGGLKRGMATCAVGGSVGWVGLLLVGLAPADALWMALAGLIVAGFVEPARAGGLRAAVQKTVPPAMQGRYWAVSNSLGRATGPISLAIGTPLAELWGVRFLWILCAMMGLAVFLIRRFVPEVYHIEDRLASAAVAEASGSGAQPALEE